MFTYVVTIEYEYEGTNTHACACMCMYNVVVWDVCTVYTCVFNVQNPQLRPPLCMLALGISGEGAYTQDPTISV